MQSIYHVTCSETPSFRGISLTLNERGEANPRSVALGEEYASLHERTLIGLSF